MLGRRSLQAVRSQAEPGNEAGNPLHAGVILAEYSESDMAQFVDYWSEKPIQWDRTKR